jgi:hypothetical protein
VRKGVLVTTRKEIFEQELSVMTRTIGLIASTFGVVCIAAAQDAPRVDFSLQYDYLRSSSNNGPALNFVNGQPTVINNAGGGNNNYNGGGAQVGYNFNKWISGIADVYAVHLHASNFGRWTDPVTGLNYNGGRPDVTTTVYQFGPRFYYRHWQRFTPFAEGFVGGANAAASIPIDLNSVTLPISQTQTVTTPNGQTITTGILGNGKQVTIANVTGPNGQTVTLAALPNGQTVAVTNVNGQFFENASINVPVPLRGTNFTCNRVLNNGTCNVVSTGTVRAQTSQNVFAYNVGGGLDITINHYLRFRPVEVDMQFTRFNQLNGFGNQNQFNFRYTGGIVFTFGKID